MRHTWSGLGLLLVVPWLAGCVTRPEIRLDTGQGPPIVHAPPGIELPPVEVHQEEFLQAMAGLVLEMPLPLQSPLTKGWVVLASWGDMEEPQQALSVDDSLVLPKDTLPSRTLARMRLALSFAMDTVWEGTSVALSEALNPQAFKLMVYTTMSTYLLLLMMPEPVTKGLAAALTVYLVAYLGFGPRRQAHRFSGKLPKQAYGRTPERSCFPQEAD